MESLHQLDLAVFRAINVGMHASWLDTFFAFFSYLGLGGVCGAVCLSLLISKSTRGYVIPLLLADAVGGFLVADGLKMLFPRDRPSHLAFAIRQEPHLLSSFPSGHTTTGFAIATMMVFLTRGTARSWWGWAALATAALIGISRIYRGVHWPTDVIAGAMCGIATSNALYLFLPRFGVKFAGTSSGSEMESTSA